MPSFAGNRRRPSSLAKVTLYTNCFLIVPGLESAWQAPVRPTDPHLVTQYNIRRSIFTYSIRKRLQNSALIVSFLTNSLDPGRGWSE